MHISIKGSETVEDDSGKPYTVYLIDVRGSKEPIRKRYSDFASFHELAAAVKSPGVSLPPLPPKKWRNNLDPSFVFNRGLDLEEYLRSYVLMTKGTKEEEMLLDFLGLSRRPSQSPALS